jgi:pilus assembly protein CpaF
MSTIHANAPVDCLARLETLCLMSGIGIPLVALQRQIASAVEVVVQIARHRGFRRVTEIAELRGFDIGTGLYEVVPIFSLVTEPSGPGGQALAWTGEKPTLPHLDDAALAALTAGWSR